MIEHGATLAEIAGRAGVHHSTVRRWLRQRGLETQRSRVWRQAAQARASEATEIDGVCRRHGAVRLRRDARGSYRCPRCNADRVSRHRRRQKEILVAEAGGACVLCGYDRSVAALQFHHLDPAQKAFGIAYRGLARSMSSAREETRKCVLLCGNCHAEVEAGVAVVKARGSVADRSLESRVEDYSQHGPG